MLNKSRAPEMRLKGILSRVWCAAVSLAKEKTVPEELMGSIYQLLMGNKPCKPSNINERCSQGAGLGKRIQTGLQSERNQRNSSFWEYLQDLKPVELSPSFLLLEAPTKTGFSGALGTQHRVGGTTRICGS